MTPLQKRALYTLIIGLVLTVALVVAIVIKGDITGFFDELNMRLIMYAALVGVPLAYLVLVNLTLKKPNQVDERDRLVLERSRTIQWLAIIFSITAWTIILTEVFRNQRQVPVEYLNLIFVSTLIISTLAQSLGILVGYRRLNRHG